MNYKIEYSNKNIEWDKLKIIKTKKVILFNDYYKELKKTKEKIDNLDDTLDWDNSKKLTNPYELVYIKNKNYNNSITKFKPVSRSFFKLIEINNKFELVKNFNLTISCLAEAPGGFVEALYYKYKKSNLNIYGISIYPSTTKIPSWNKLNNIIRSKKIKLLYGNLYKKESIKKYLLNFNNYKANLVTADGGFDFSKNFNEQELDSHHIIFNEIMVSILILKKGGNFICKIFDIFNLFTVQIIYLLNSLFKEVYLYKPNTSRTANSEKYIICKSFIGGDNKLYNNCKRLILEIDNKLIKNKNIKLNINVPNDFIHLINKYNKKYIEQQIFYLNKTLDIINKKYNNIEFNNMRKQQIKNGIKWCKDNDMEINQKSIYI